MPQKRRRLSVYDFDDMEKGPATDAPEVRMSESGSDVDQALDSPHHISTVIENGEA
jgi:hypothetical protein